MPGRGLSRLTVADHQAWETMFRGFFFVGEIYEIGSGSDVIGWQFGNGSDDTGNKWVEKGTSDDGSVWFDREKAQGGKFGGGGLW